MENLGDTEAGAGLIYKLRCSLLHQGSMQPYGGKQAGRSRVAFVEPGAGSSLHNVATIMDGGEEVHWLDVATFIEEVATATVQWLSTHEDDAQTLRNLARFARRRAEGLPPHVTGVAVIT